MAASSSGSVGFVPNSGRHSRSCELREASVSGLLALFVVAAPVLPACDDADRAIADESVQTFHRHYLAELRLADKMGAEILSIPSRVVDLLVK